MDIKKKKIKQTALTYQASYSYSWLLLLEKRNPGRINQKWMKLFAKRRVEGKEKGDETSTIIPFYIVLILNYAKFSAFKQILKK